MACPAKLYPMRPKGSEVLLELNNGALHHEAQRSNKCYKN